MTHARTHGGHALAAKRRGEEWLTCTCTTHTRPYRQAGPIEAEPQMPFVRLANYALSALTLWMVLIAWVLSEFGDNIRRFFGGVA